MKKIKLTFLYLLSLLMISCGFHLRGNQDLSAILPEVQIQGTNKHSELSRELNRALTVAKVNVLDESETVLNITQDKLSKRVLSIDSDGHANQYELSYQLSFSLAQRTHGDKPSFIDLIPAQSISEKREYLFDADLVLAKANEESRLNNDMRQAAIFQLIRRLSFSLKAKRKIELKAK